MMNRAKIEEIAAAVGDLLKKQEEVNLPVHYLIT